MNARTWLALTGLIGSSAVAGCCGGGGPDSLSIHLDRHSTFPDGTPAFGSDAPRWGDAATLDTGDNIRILFEQDAELHGDVLELYAADGSRVPLPGDDSFAPTDNESCAHNERVYSLKMVEPGDYTLVHRRRNGTGDDLNCGGECPWTTFDGDEALVLALTITP